MQSKKIFFFFFTLMSSFCIAMDQQPNQERLYQIGSTIKLRNDMQFKVTRITNIGPKAFGRGIPVTVPGRTLYHAKSPIVPLLLEHKATFEQTFDSKEVTCINCKPGPTLYAWAGLAALGAYGLYRLQKSFCST